MELVQTFNLTASPERVGMILCSEAFNVEIEKQRQEVVHTEFRLTGHDDDQILFEIHSEEYMRKMTGAIDRSKTVHTLTRHHYSERNRTLAWSYEGQGAKWVTVSGIYHLNTARQGTELVHRVQIEVHIPLLGGQIAKLIAREFDRAFSRFQDLLQRHVEAGA